jgi:micrococcal nuclease
VRRLPPRRFASLAVTALVLASLIASIAGGSGASPRALEGFVVRIVDGDTIHVRIGDRTEKVRYIGVNTPEVHHPRKGEEPGGREASRVNRDLVAGKHVRLEFDVRDRDRYGRLLAYVWLDDVMVNAELVRLGYAQVMTVPPNVRYQQLFLKLQRDAREAGRGLWRGV